MIVSFNKYCESLGFEVADEHSIHEIREILDQYNNIMLGKLDDQISYTNNKINDRISYIKKLYKSDKSILNNVLSNIYQKMGWKNYEILSIESLKDMNSVFNRHDNLLNNFKDVNKDVSNYDLSYIWKDLIKEVNRLRTLIASPEIKESLGFDIHNTYDKEQGIDLLNNYIEVLKGNRKDLSDVDIDIKGVSEDQDINSKRIYFVYNNYYYYDGKNTLSNILNDTYLKNMEPHKYSWPGQESIITEEKLKNIDSLFNQWENEILDDDHTLLLLIDEFKFLKYKL